MINLLKFLPKILSLLASMSPTLKKVLGASLLFIGFFTYFNNMWANLFARIDALVVPASIAADFTPLSLVNYVFPLDTVCSYISAYLTFRLACVGIRVVKSMIPTIA